jgi:hypothetical protein
MYMLYTCACLIVELIKQQLLKLRFPLPVLKVDLYQCVDLTSTVKYECVCDIIRSDEYGGCTAVGRFAAGMT